MDLKVALEKAIEIATIAHKGQIDKQGVDYIQHPLRVMAAVDGDLEKIVAILHDTLEDTEETEETLLAKGIPQEAIDKVKILTRGEDETYDEYVERVSKDAICRKIKLADLQDNLRDGCPESLQKRYKKAQAFLMGVQ